MKKSKLAMPHVYLLIIMLIVLAGILTYIIPAGVYDYVEVDGKQVIDPNSFHYLEESTPVGIWSIITSIPGGLMKQASIIFMVILIGGGIEIVNGTRALDAAISKIALSLQNMLYVCVPITLLAFGFFGQIGALTASMALVPLGILVAKCLGGDACVGVTLVTVAANTGFAAAAFSAPNTGIAQTICGIPMFSGSTYRIICWLVLTAINSVYVIRYIKKIRNDPTKSVCHGIQTAIIEEKDVDVPELTPKRKAVVAVFLVGMAVVIYGSIKNWSATVDIPMIFVLTGIVCGLVYGFTPNKVMSLFVKGCKDASPTGIICGFAGGISILLTNGNIIHTVVHGLSNISSSLPVAVSAIVMFFANTIINFFILSGSGQATVVMPIFSPLASVLGMSQQTAVLAFGFGDGLSNAILPTSAATMSGIGIAGVPYDRWLKYIFKLFLVQCLACCILLVIAVAIGYGP